MTSELRCLAVRQPWAFATVRGWKTIENRSRDTSFRGCLLIHACLQFDEAGERRLKRLGYDVDENDLLVGGVIGSVELVGIVRQSDSDGPVGYVLRNPRSLPFLPQRGQAGLFRPSIWVLNALGRQKSWKG